MAVICLIVHPDQLAFNTPTTLLPAPPPVLLVAKQSCLINPEEQRSLRCYWRQVELASFVPTRVAVRLTKH